MTNTLLLIWAIGLFDLLLNKNINTNLENLPVIEAEYDVLKTPPPEQELFPTADSPLWKSMDENMKEKGIEEKNKDNDLIENSNQNTTFQNPPKQENNVQNSKDKKLVVSEFSEKKNYNEEISEKDLVDINKKKEKKTNKEDINKDSADNRKKNFYIQLASLTEENLIEKEWKRLKNKYKPELDKLTYMTEKAKINNKTFFRLLVGNFINEENARIFCTKIKIKYPCLVRSF